MIDLSPRMPGHLACPWCQYDLFGLGMLGSGIWVYRRARGILRHMYQQLAGADKRRNS